MEDKREVYNYGFFIFHQLFEDNILSDTGFRCCFKKYAVSLITICLFVFVGDVFFLWLLLRSSLCPW